MIFSFKLDSFIQFLKPSNIFLLFLQDSANNLF
jgi:hypothetical protein